MKGHTIILCILIASIVSCFTSCIDDGFTTSPSDILTFSTDTIKPSFDFRTRQDTIWLGADSIAIDTIKEVQYTHFMPDNIVLRAFTELPVTQYMVKNERLVPQKFSFYFSAPADTLPLIQGMNFDEKNAFIIEKTAKNDTIHYWIKDSLLYKRDTLQAEITYLETDSLGKLVPRTDTLRLQSKLTYEKQVKQKKEQDEKKLEALRKEAKKKKKRDADGNVIETPEPVLPTEFLPVEVYAPSSMDVYDYITLTFQEPLARIDTAAFHMQHKVDTLWQDIPFDFQRDSLDLKVYNVFANFELGESYQFAVDSAAIQGLYGLTTDKVKQEFKVKTLEEYGTILFDIVGADSASFVELLDAQDQVIRTVSVVDGKADFYYLTPGKYGARLVVDKNKNGKWDTGNFEEHIQPEMVYYYFQLLELKANFELQQTWILTDRPLDQQKPMDLKKQKPEESKKKKRNASTNR